MKAVLGTLLMVLIALGLASPAAAATPLDQVTVTNDRATVDTQIGGRFEFTTTVRNDGDQAITGLVAHLNILSIDPGTYVDPEDWSSQRTIYLDPIPAGGSQALPWRVQAVNDGQFVLYVAVTASAGPAPVAAGDGIRLSAAAQSTVNAGGVLPVALGVPAVVLALTLLNAGRRRRLR